MNLQETFTAAKLKLDGGDLAGAAGLFRQILDQQPQNGPSLYLLGIIALQVGQLKQAVELLRRAVAADPHSPEYRLNFGAALDTMGQVDQAIEVYRQTLAIKSDSVPALSNLGNALRRKNRPQEAIAVLRRALAVQPDFTQAQHNLGLALDAVGDVEGALTALSQAVVLQPSADVLSSLAAVLLNAGRYDQAISVYRQLLSLQPILPQAWASLATAYCQTGNPSAAADACRQAISIDPNFAIGHNNLGKALQDQGDLPQAAASFRRAIELQPDTPDFYCNLGVALYQQRDWDAAITSLLTAIALRPDYTDAHNNLGAVYQARCHWDKAIACYRQAILHSPQNAEGYNNLGSALKHVGDFAPALECTLKALQLRPDYAGAHWNLGLYHLLMGNLEKGFAECEWRGRAKELSGPPIDIPKPRWDGSPLNGTPILLHAEQGYGDAIHFCRYAPLVAARGGKVLMVCPEGLISLVRRMDGVHAAAADSKDLPEFNLHCPLLSLPHVLKTTLATIPAKIPYLHCDPTKAVHWAERLAAHPGRKIGLVWAGNPKHANDPSRSIPLAMYDPFSKIPGVHFIRLQKGVPSAASAVEMTDWTEDLHDFDDTAALIANLDLIITVDTSVAHLAGALGKPVYLLLPFVAEWRWMLDRTDSPWYPTMRLFRQPTAGDWPSVITNVVTALETSPP